MLLYKQTSRGRPLNIQGYPGFVSAFLLPTPRNIQGVKNFLAFETAFLPDIIQDHLSLQIRRQ